MAQRRTVLTQFLTELAHTQDAAARLTPEALTAWHSQANQDHSHGHKAISYEPAVSSSKEPPAPSLDRDDKRIEAELRQVFEHLRNTRIQLDWVARTLHARITPTKRMPDPEPRPCTNPHCTEVFSMIGRDRPHNETGRCEPCRKFSERHDGAEWTPRKGTINA